MRLKKIHPPKKGPIQHHISPPTPPAASAHCSPTTSASPKRSSSNTPHEPLPYSPTSPASQPQPLQSDRENRILFYPGCFNTPHAGHAALLWHTYLLTDASTIAVLIFCLPDESLSSKENTSNKSGKDFILTHFQRRKLWKDDILSRFTCVFRPTAGMMCSSLCG
jgi:hypothetical protein